MSAVHCLKPQRGMVVDRRMPPLSIIKKLYVLKHPCHCLAQIQIDLTPFSHFIYI